MKKLLLLAGVLFISTVNAQDSFFSSDEELKKEDQNSQKLDEIDKMKSMEIEQAKKSIALFENNPVVQSLLMEFLKQIIVNSEGKYTELLGKYTNDLNNKIKNRLTEEIEVFRLENEKLQKILEEKRENSYKTLKGMIANEVEKIKGIKIELEDKQKQNEKQMALLVTMFGEIQEKMDSYTKYIDAKFSLSAVKEIELSRIFLLKEDFPIKYIKNFNNKAQISIVLNNEKQYGINSMITERCRISDITNTHISVECIDVNNKIYKNVMKLKIVSAKDDYILNSISKQLKISNKKYQNEGVKEGKEAAAEAKLQGKGTGSDLGDSEDVDFD